MGFVSRRLIQNCSWPLLMSITTTSKPNFLSVWCEIWRILFVHFFNEWKECHHLEASRYIKEINKDHDKNFCLHPRLNAVVPWHKFLSVCEWLEGRGHHLEQYLLLKPREPFLNSLAGLAFNCRSIQEWIDLQLKEGEAQSTCQRKKIVL